MVDKGGSAAGVARASTDQYFISASATSDRHPSLLLVPSLVPSSPLLFAILRLVPFLPRELRLLISNLAVFFCYPYSASALMLFLLNFFLH
jgi:hypothetical protein